MRPFEYFNSWYKKISMYKSNLEPIVAKFQKHYNHRFSTALRNKLLNTPCGLAFISVAVCYLFVFILPGPIYMVGDDIIMRGRVEGTLIQGLPASEFAEYLPIVTGKYLRFLYSAWSGLFWYDIVWYGLMTMSVFVIVHTLTAQTDRLSTCYKIAVGFALPIFFSLGFIAVQFSIVAAFLVVSAVVVFLSLACSERISTLSYLVKSIYIVFAMYCSALVRVESTIGITIFCVFLLPPLLPWKNIKKMAAIFTPFVVGAVCIMGLLYFDHKARQNNPDWKYWIDYNDAIVKLNNDSVFSLRIDRDTVFKRLHEGGIDFYERDKFIWDDAHQRLLLSFEFLDDQDGGFDLANILKVKKAYANSIKILGNTLPAIKFEKNNLDSFTDGSRWCLWYSLFLLSLLIISPAKPFRKYLLYIFIATVAFLFLLSLSYRPLPFRMHYSLFLLPPVCLLSFITYRINFAVAGRKVLKFSPRWVSQAVSCVLLIAAAYSTLHPQAITNQHTMTNYNNFNSFITTLSKDNIYGLIPWQLYISRPFDRYKIYDLGLKVIYFSSPLEEKRVREIYARWYSSTGKNSFEELFNSGKFQLLAMKQYGGVRSDIVYYMYKVKNLRLGIISDELLPKNKKSLFATYQYHILDEQTSEFRDDVMRIHYSSINPNAKSYLTQARVNNFYNAYIGDDPYLALLLAFSFFESVYFSDYELNKKESN